MNEKLLPIIAPVCQLITSKRNVSNSRIKKTVRELRFFKSTDGNIGFRIKELCNSAGNAVQFHTIHFQSIHSIRHKPHKISDPAGWFQNISLLQPHIFQCLVHGFYNYWRCVKSVQRGFSCCPVFIRFKLRMQFDKFIRPCFIPFFKCFLQTTPSYIFRQDYLLIRRGCCPPFVLYLVKQSDCIHVGTEFFFCASRPQIFICNTEINPLFLAYFGHSFFRFQWNMIILTDSVNRIQRHHLCGKMFQFPLYSRLIIHLQTFQYIKNQLHLFRRKIRI